MDFREAESRFVQLQENYQNEAISEESFFQSVSKLMVQDTRGVYWTIDPKTGNWLFYDGHVWQRSVPPTKEITDKIRRIPKPQRTGGWAFGLLAGGFVIFGVVVVVALIAYRTFVLVHPPKVEILSPISGSRVLVGEAMPIEILSSSSKGINRVELWVDDQLVLPETNVPLGAAVPMTLHWVFQESGSYELRVKAYSASGAQGESQPVILEVAPPKNRALPVLVVLQGSADVRLGQEEPWRPVESDSYLQVGGSVRTQGGGRVQLVFSKDTVAELGENTEVLLHEATLPQGDLPYIALFLSYGDTWHQLDTQGTSLRYEIETASARVVSEGTLIHVLLGPERETLVEVAEGDAVIMGAGESLKLTAGQKARVEPDEAPALFLTPPLPTVKFNLTPTVTPRD